MTRLKPKSHYEKMIVAEVARFQDMLYLNDWVFYVAFGKLLNEDDDADDEDSIARIYMHSPTHRGKIIFNERMKPELYPWAAAHEVLHPRLWMVEQLAHEYEGYIGQVMGHEMHAALDFIARALSGVKAPADGEYLLPKPPWEAA